MARAISKTAKLERIECLSCFHKQLNQGANSTVPCSPETVHGQIEQKDLNDYGTIHDLSWGNRLRRPENSCIEGLTVFDSCTTVAERLEDSILLISADDGAIHDLSSK
jgi:hypothetical protein